MSSLGLTEGGFSHTQIMSQIRLGPHKYLTFDPNGPGVELEGGAKIAWNSMEDCLDVYHADGSTLQTGLEQHIIVHNSTANTLYNGTCVCYDSVFEDGDFVPSVVPLIGDGNTKPYYTFGLLTNTIAPSGFGRVTSFGKVRDIDTTGDAAGEEWIIGDILYVHPSMAGKLTRVRPSTPNPVIGIALVLRVSETEGILFVKPNIDKIMHFGHFTRNTNLAIPTTATNVTFDMDEGSLGVRLDVTGSKIVFDHPGLYSIGITSQLYSNNSSNKTIKFWWSKNGKNIDRSTTAVTNSVRESYFASTRIDMFDIERNDELELRVISNVLGASLTAITEDVVNGVPASPSINIRIVQVQN
jgi:hypothetical protein